MTQPQHIFIANPKGGCGKTTIATQLAGYFACNEFKTVLVDHDAQRSSSDWLSSRPKKCAAIDVVVAKPEAHLDVGDADKVIHDMPAAWSLEHVADILQPLHKVLVPVLASPNDIKACLRFLMALTRSGVLEHGVSIGLVANRVRRQVGYTKVLESFIERVDFDVVGQVRDSQNYVRVMDAGLSLFDLPPGRIKADLEQWRPIIEWLCKM